MNAPHLTVPIIRAKGNKRRQIVDCRRMRPSNSNSRPHPHDDRAEGMLLYATVGENNYVHRFAMPPHQMTVATVDLNMPWQGIEQRLMDLILNQPQPTLS